MKSTKEGELKPEWKVFAENYIFDYNGTRSYQAAYPDSSYDSARSSSSDLLAKPIIQAHIKALEEDLAKTAGISRLRVLREHQKIAFSTIANLHNSWIERKEFDKLTQDEKDCIAEIQTQIKTSRNSDGTLEENEFVKVKLYDKQKALDSINRMLGYDAPEKVEHTIPSLKTYKIVAAGGEGTKG